jgi:hypothetical protein
MHDTMRHHSAHQTAAARLQLMTAMVLVFSGKAGSSNDSDVLCAAAAAKQGHAWRCTGSNLRWCCCRRATKGYDVPSACTVDSVDDRLQVIPHIAPGQHLLCSRIAYI